ncbi:MAG: PEP-CTERM sorting domain-containing protein [Alphaproteobacteria bacterium]
MYPRPASSPRAYLAAAFAAILIVVSAPAQAAVIVDQEVDLPSSGFNDIGTPQWQSFLQAGDNIAGAAVRIDSTDSNGDPLSGSITLTILDGAPDGGGTAIATATALAATATPAPDDERWFTVFFAPVTVIPETELFLQVTSDNDFIGLASINSSPYTRGTSFPNGVSSSGGKKGKNADLAFRTFTDTSFSTSIPEPGILVTFGLGLAVLGASGRRKR